MSISAESLEIAERLRGTGPEISIPREMKNYERQIVYEEQRIPTTVGDSRVFVFRPQTEQENLPVYINFHGGGFVLRYNQTNPSFCSMIARELNCVVVDVDYRLAPENPFPIALNEGYDVVKWIFQNAASFGMDANRVAVGGHSAGATLTAGIALKANMTKEFAMVLQFMDYPVLDLFTPPEEKLNKEEKQSFLTLERMNGFNELYIPDIGERKNPLASPIYAAHEMLMGLPPALMITAQKDVLRFEAEKYASMLVEAGVRLTAKRFLHSGHGFTMYYKQEYKQAHQLIIEELARAFKQ